MYGPPKIDCTAPSSPVITSWSSAHLLPPPAAWRFKPHTRSQGLRPVPIQLYIPHFLTPQPFSAFFTHHLPVASDFLFLIASSQPNLPCNQDPWTLGSGTLRSGAPLLVFSSHPLRLLVSGPALTRPRCFWLSRLLLKNVRSPLPFACPLALLTAFLKSSIALRHIGILERSARNPSIPGRLSSPRRPEWSFRPP